MAKENISECSGKFVIEVVPPTSVFSQKTQIWFVKDHLVKMQHVMK